jgi:hypothetical protein
MKKPHLSFQINPSVIFDILVISYFSVFTRTNLASKIPNSVLETKTQKAQLLEAFGGLPQ